VAEPVLVIATSFCRVNTPEMSPAPFTSSVVVTVM
jgi:hypothetical protein